MPIDLTRKYKLVLLTLISLAIGLSIGSFDISNLSERAPSSKFLDVVKSAAKQPSMTPTSLTSEVSPAIFDAQFTDGLNTIEVGRLLRKDGLDREALYIKLPDNRTVTSLQLALPKSPDVDSTITMEDNVGRILFKCFGPQCRSSTILLAPATTSVRLQFTDYERSGDFDGIELTILKAQEIVPALKLTPKITISLDEIQKLQFSTLSKKAKRLSESGSWAIPGNRISGTIFCCSDDREAKSKVRIRLSGRNSGHFEVFPPSISVSIIEGATILGAQRFKLYRPSQRQGLLDHVVHSILFDQGMLIPPQQFVEVYIEKDFAGYFLFEETYSTGFFENLRLSEGDIYGFNSKWFFQDYPKKIRLSPDKFYTADSGYSLDNLNFLFGSDFLSRIDKESFAKLIALTGIFMGTHGLGADDLRFYRDPLGNRFLPIARDLKIGAWPQSEAGFNKSFNSHLSFIVSNRAVSVQPFFGLSLNGEDLDPTYSGSALGVWDVHPAVLGFLETLENRLLVERMILDYSRSSLFQIFQRRLSNALEFMAKANSNRPERNAYDGAEEALYIFEDQQSHLDNPESVFLGPGILSLISNTPLLIEPAGQNRWRVFNRLPFHILIDSSKSDCVRSDGMSIVGANPNGYIAKPTKDSLRQIETLYETGPLLPHRPRSFCTFSISNPSSLAPSLANGQPIAVETFPETHLATTDNFDQSEKSNELSRSVNYPEHGFSGQLDYASCFAKYVNSFEDLQNTFQSESISTTASQWGKVHYLNYGHKEDRLDRLELDCQRILSTYLQDHTAIVFLLDQYRSRTHLHLKYLINLGKGLRHNDGLLQLFDPHNIPISHSKAARLRAATELAEDVIPEQPARIMEALLSDSLRFLNQGGAIYEIDIPLSPSLGYFHVNPGQVSELIDGPVERLFVFDSRENIIPPLDKPANTESILHLTTPNPDNPKVAVVTDPIVVPKNEKLILGPGSRLLFERGTYIFVEGELQIQGTKDNPVILTALNDTWGGIILNGSSDESQIEHADISKILSPQPYLGGISVLRSKLRVSQSKISDILSEDGINVSHGELHFVRSTIQKTKSDCVDSDFSTGVIDDSTVRACGGDGVDLNHSLFRIQSSTLTNNSDKGLSCGEKSVCHIIKSHISKNSTAVAVKDSSMLFSEHNTFYENPYGIASFVKKPWYGTPYVSDSDSVFTGDGLNQVDLGYFRY